MDNKEFLPDPTLTQKENKICCEIMRKTGFMPVPAPEAETNAILSWLTATKKDWPNLMTYVYKDCCFQKLDGKWVIAMRTNDFLFRDLINGRENNG